MEKLPNNASESAEGIIYQIYMSLFYCKDLIEGEVLYFEKFGDITISNDRQIEVKKYNEDLTDSHINIWKTIKNWLHESFDPTMYKKLILLTTQKFSKNSTLTNWNSKSESEKYQVLERIYKSSKERNSNLNKNGESQALKFMNIIFDGANKQKLKKILDKFIILDSTPLLDEQYKNLFYTCTPGIIETNKKSFLNSLLGFIISPDTMKNPGGWSITYSQIENERVLLTKALCKDTSIFPKKHFEKELTISHGDYKDKLFVRKIEDIGYKEVILKAKMDYVKTCDTICDEFKNGIIKNRLKYYQEDLIESFIIKHRNHKRNAGEDKVLASLNFYDFVTSEESNTLDGFQSTPRDFKNGIIHIHMDDDSKDLKWNLK